MCTLPENFIIACPLLNHQKGPKAIANTVDIENHGLCESIHQCCGEHALYIGPVGEKESTKERGGL